jgi:hypothetical protein
MRQSMHEARSAMDGISRSLEHRSSHRRRLFVLTVLIATVLPALAQSAPDDPYTGSHGVSLLHDDCSCTPYPNKLIALDKFLRPGQIPYKNTGPNSNTVVTTAIDSMGLPRPQLPFWHWRAPGWGDPLPGWPPPGAGNAKK